MTTTPTLDVTTLPVAQRHATIFRRLEELAPGSALVLVADHAPRPLLEELLERRPLDFDWNVLEAGPARWRIEIVARVERTMRGVTEVLQLDHRRLDTLLDIVEELVAHEKIDEALPRFAELQCGLLRHIRIEEDVLFPFFERCTGIVTGPTVVMREEHGNIIQRMEQAGAALAAREGGFPAASSLLFDVLKRHNLKEERILYPACDRAALDPVRREALVRAMMVVV
jgi:uncharacterized protein (DUF2249 family)